MAVKCLKKVIPRLNFSGKRKSGYNLRNSSFNLSLNSPPKITKRLSSSLNIINKHSTKKLVSMQERKREYSLRNSSFNLRDSSPLQRTARSLESTPNIKTKPPLGNKFKKLNCTPGRKKENSLRNSYSTVSHNSKRKRKNANCIEYTPKNEHPMRKKLRELAYTSTPKNTSATDQNLAIDKDLNSCVLTRNKRKVLNSISKSLDSENALQSSKKSATCRMSTRSISKTTVVSEKCTKTLKEVTKANSSVSEGVGSVRKEKSILRSQPVNISNSVQAQLKGVIVRVVPICEDELVYKPKYINSVKGGAKSSLETPVKQNLSRILRSKDNCAERSLSGYSPKASFCYRVTDNIVLKRKDSLKANHLDTLTPVTTRLKKRPCEVKYLSQKVVIAADPERGRKKSSVFETSSGARQFPCVDDLVGKKDSFVKTSTQKEIGTGEGEGKEQVEFQRKTRNTKKVFEKNLESPIEKRITRSTTFGNTFEELSPFDSLPKKSKRHTFPNSNKSSKSKNHLRVYSVDHFNNVPLDVLTKPYTSFHESMSHTSKTDSMSVKKVAPKVSLKGMKAETKLTKIKSPVPKVSLKGKKVEAKLPKIKSPVPKVSLKGKKAEAKLPKIKSPVPKVSLKGKKAEAKLPKIKSPVPKVSLKGKKAEAELPEKTSDPNKKIPAVGTLKRKRWIMKTLKDKSEGYEDDIFENRRIEFLKPFVGSMISDDESDATDVSIATPTCGFLLTPNISRRSPLYKPCISSNDLTAARRVAEEYLYRRNKTWKQACKNFPENKAVSSENSQCLEKNKEYSEALDHLLKAQADIEKLTQEESEEEDDYFSDVS